MMVKQEIATKSDMRFGAVYQHLSLSPHIELFIDLLFYITMTVVIYSLCARAHR